MMASTLQNVALLVAQTAAALPKEWRLRWSWDWPLWVTVASIVAASLWVLSIYFREASPAGSVTRTLLGLLRLTALALVLLMFAQPAIEWFRLGRPRLVLLVDRSASMDTLDRYPVTPTGASHFASRLATWQALLTEGEPSLLAQWQSTYQLEVIAFDQQIERLTDSEASLASQLQAISLADDASGGTRLGDAVDYALRELPGEPPLAIVILSDGIATLGQTLHDTAERARRLRVPLYTVAVGSDRRRPDIGVENLIVEEIVFPGDRLQVEATVRVTGYAGKPTEVVLRDVASQQILARTTLQLPTDDATETVRLAIRPNEPGELTLELAVEPLEDEANVDNNVVRQVIEVRDEKIQVLLVQAQPSYEYRALKSLLERDPAVALRAFLQEADVDYATVDDTALRSFPASESELFAYDVLLLGDADPGLLPRSIWPWVERFVIQQGGGMVGIAGPQFMPSMYRGIRSMELLLPMDLDALNPLRSQLGGTDEVAVQPTALGWRTPSLQLGETVAESQQIWSALPPLLWMLRIDDIKSGGQVLAEHPELINRQGRRLPVILRHYVGAGEVLFHATDETWRWRGQTDDRFFARYWGQVVRRLGRGRLAAGRQGARLTADRSQYEPGETVQLQVRFRNPSQAPAAEEQVIVQLQGSTGPTRQLALQRRLGRRGIFSTTVDDLESSEYVALLVQPDLGGPTDTARFEIRQPPRELAQVVVNQQGLSRAAEISGGKSYTVATAGRLAQALPPPRHQSLDELPPRQLWNSHAIMALVVIVLTSEWLLRRRYGML